MGSEQDKETLVMGGDSVMRAEHLQMWLAEATREERPGMKKWDKVVDIIQSTIREGRIPMECAWKTVVLIPKGNGTLYGIRLVEDIWKAMSGVVNFRIGLAVYFYDTLHGFMAGIGTGTASLEVKLIHKMTAMRDEVLYEAFIDTQKSNADMDQERCMEILVG